MKKKKKYKLRSKRKSKAGNSVNISNFLSSIELPIVLLNPENKIRRFTPAAAQLLNLSNTDIGSKLNNIDHAFEYLNGQRYRTLVNPYRNVDNKVDGSIVTFIKTDVRNYADDDKMTIIQNIPIPFLILNSEKKVKFASNYFYNKFQTTPEQTENQLITDLGNGIWNTPQLMNVFDKMLCKEFQFYSFEIELDCPKIGKKIMMLNATCTELLGENTKNALLALEDITEIRQVERKLKNSEEKYRNLITNAHDGVLVIKRNGVIEFVNPQLEKIFGYAPGELLNKHYGILFQEKDEKVHFSYYKNQRPKQHKLLKTPEILGLRKDGSIVPLAIFLSPFKSNSGVLAHCTIRDISVQKKLDEDRKKLLQQEIKLRDDAINNNRIKDEFLATLSHELRTPLTAILGWAQELRSSSEDKKTIDEGLSVIERSAQTQGQLINDLLDISRIQSSKLSLDMKIIDVVRFLNLAIASVRKSAEKKSISIETNIPTNRCLIFADQVRIQQIFWNLLTNAIKFTPEGGKIFISLNICNQLNNKIAEVKITDTGIGIKPEFLSRIFQRFSQADSSTARTHGGLGLGMAITKSLIEMQNGKVTAESEGEGKGASFTIRIPMMYTRENENNLPVSTHEQQKPPARLDGMKILAVDDNEDNRVLFSIILKSLGADIKVADSVQETMKILPEFNPDIILSDISMPVEDGYCLLNKIRANEKTKAGKLPIVALTAHAGPDDVQRVLNAGFSGYVAKPVEKALLAQVILNLVKA